MPWKMSHGRRRYKYRGYLCTAGPGRQRNDLDSPEGYGGKADKVDRPGKKEESLGGLLLSRKGFQCGRLLGRGSFSWVYQVERREDRQTYACKVSQNEKLLEREAQAMALLKHPLFPAYFAFWMEAGLGLLVIEYVPGCSLEEALLRRGQFSAGQTIRVGLALAEGLGYLHERGLLFRDVKPSNIMARQDGRVKLIDFGCVCSMEGEVCSRAGTPGYAAPEQLSGAKKLTPACDVYGLGRTLEAMLGTDAKGVNDGALGTRMKAILDKKGFPQERDVLLRKYTGVKSIAERRKKRRLREIIQMCTQQEAERRLPDMAQVGLALRKLSDEEEDLKEM